MKEQSIEFRNKIISILSHETKGLFANIFWMIEMMESQYASQEMLENMLPELKSIADKNLQYYTDTLNWIKSQHDNFVLNNNVVNGFELYESLNDFFLKKLSEKNQQFIFEGDKEISFSSDKVLVQIILKKLIENAIFFSDSEKVIIFKISKSSDKEKININIQDNGVGMSEDESSIIFTNQMKPKANTNNEIGLGLGLRFAKEMSEIFGGEINIVSKEGAGTIATLVIPLN